MATFTYEVQPTPNHTPRDWDRKSSFSSDDVDCLASQWVYPAQDPCIDVLSTSTGSASTVLAPPTSMVTPMPAQAFEPMPAAKGFLPEAVILVPAVMISPHTLVVSQKSHSPKIKAPSKEVANPGYPKEIVVDRGQNVNPTPDRLEKGRRCVSFLGQYVMNWSVTIILTFNPKGRNTNAVEIAAGLQSLELCEQLEFMLQELGMYMKDKPYVDDYTKPLIKIPVNIQRAFLVEDFLRVETKIRATLKKQLLLRDRIQLKNLEVKTISGNIIASLKVEG
jgi:hypothetical protein